MNLKQLRAFVQVAEQQSFTRAAETLYLTQPAVSWQIKSLENALGVALLERHDRQVLLTEAGRMVLPLARQLVTLGEEIFFTVAQFRGLQKGRLRLGASTIPGECILPYFLEAFLERHPGLGLHLEIGDTASVLQLVKDRSIDLGVVGARPVSEGLRYYYFLEDELVLLIPPRYQLAWEEGAVAPEALKDYPIVMRERGSGTRAVVSERLAACGLSLDELPVILELGSTRAVITAVEAGLGISLASRWAVQEAVIGGRLVIRNLAGVNLKRALYVVTVEHSELGPVGRAFRDFLLDSEVQKGVLKRCSLLEI